MRISGAATLVLLLALTVAPASAGTTSTTGALVCRHAKVLRSGTSRPAVRPTIAIAGTGDATLRLGKPRVVCLPAVTSGDAPALTSAFAAWEVRRRKGEDVPGDRAGESVTLETALTGTFDARLAALTRVLVATTAAPGDGGAPPLQPPASELLCQSVRTSAKSPPHQTLITAFGTHQLRVERPRRLCDATSARGWVCHRARAERGAPSPHGDVVSLGTPFGAAVLRLGPVAEVCVPALNDVTPPSFTVRVEPPSQTIEYLQTADARAFADYDDGHSEEITARVSWSSGDATIADLLEDSPVPNRFVGRNPGTTTLIATDPTTGAHGEASLTVEWTLQSIDVHPSQVNRVIGQGLSFTAIGRFASGAELNVTQRVAWSTADPAIATAAGTGAPSPSRVTGVAFGTTSVRACDPITGICSTDSDADATFVVQGGLQFIEITPEVDRSVLPGQGIRFTAIAHYADGREQNFTQRAQWRSTDTAIATAQNADGDRSRIDGVAPGITTIIAKDPATGIESFPRTLFVLGELYRIDVHPHDSNGDAVRPPGSRRLTAIGQYVGGGHKNITQDVTWHSRDPEIGIATNTPGDRSRIDSAGSAGQARIWADDPATGIASDDAIFRVLGELVGLDLYIPRRGLPPYNRVPVGALLRLFVYGRFSTGEQLNMTRFFPGTVTIESSDPSLGAIVDDEAVRGVHEGVVQLHAIDTVSGFEGAPFEVTVQGALERLIVHRINGVTHVGVDTGVQVFGQYPPGLTLPFVGPLDVAISDESVLAIAGRHRETFRVQALAQGAATISVTDPATGVSSADTGDDATITVLGSSPPVSVAVTPPVTTLPVDGEDELTAVATFPEGFTLNVTQQATWSSNAPDVADVVGPKSTNASRIVGRKAGVATITATYGGVSSTTSGEDGIAVVSDALSLTVLGADQALGVDESRALRATAQLANGRILNVTKMLEYRSLDTSVADFLDPEDPTIVTGLGVGEVDIDVGLPNSPVRTTVHLIVSDDPATTTTSPTTTTTTTTVTAAPLRIEPSSQTVDFGQTTQFRAMRGTVDVSDAVAWAVDDPAIASTDDGATKATDAGATTIRVLDGATGSVAAASLTVEWSLRGITLWPRQANREVGDWERFTALGTFKRGGTAVVTDRLQYAIADPAVATLQSSAENPSEVVALQTGRTTISACDPLTNVCSGNAGSAMLLVGGGLQSITVTPGASVSHFLGESEQYTAVGHFADGSTQDLTTTVTWSVGNASVARASNTAGTRGRVYALSPGQTPVVATDPESGIVSNAAGPFVALGTLQSIVLEPAAYMQAGASQRLRAWGIFEGGGSRDFTQAVTYEIDDASIAAAPNATGDRNRIDAVAPGTTVVRARLASAGLVSNDVPVAVYGAITSLAINTRSTTRLGIGGRLDVSLTAVFDSPGFFYSENLTRSGRAYQLVSDDADVLAAIDGDTVEGVGGGIAHLTAVDPASGVSSPPVTITVQGVLQSISLSPDGVTRALGELQSFTAIGHYVPSLTSLLTQQVEYRSSDESVAIALNTPGNKSQVLMVGPGTAVISATDPVTGIGSSDSGGDVTVTVRPGLLDRIVISPPFVRRMWLDQEEFTATGFYPDGTSINVTQQVEWLSSDSSVAGAFGPPNRRSLFEATGPGTAVVSAVHPQGVSSSDSGHDAIMEVDQVVALHMTPAQRFLAPGQSAQLTVRATMASGADVNVTQLATYFTTSPGIVGVPNAPPRKSEVTAIAPGTATVQAFFGFRGTSATVTVRGGSPSGAFLD